MSVCLQQKMVYFLIRDNKMTHTILYLSQFSFNLHIKIEGVSHQTRQICRHWMALSLSWKLLNWSYILFTSPYLIIDSVSSGARLTIWPNIASCLARSRDTGTMASLACLTRGCGDMWGDMWWAPGRGTRGLGAKCTSCGNWGNVTSWRE